MRRVTSRKTERSARKAISLFSGAGGIDYGIDAAGFDVAVALERDHDCCETLRVSRPGVPVIEDDIMRVDTRTILEAGGLRVGEAALLVGGPPCQPFSKAGYWKRGDSLRLDDPRANTLAAYMRVVEGVLPAVFIMENVEGLAYDGKDEGLKLILARLDKINRKTKSHYAPVIGKLNAADVGVPQLRERVFVIAARDGSEFSFPKPTHGDADDCELLPNLEPYRTAWDALADVGPEPGEDVAMKGKYVRLLPSIPEGQNYLFHTDRGGGRPLFGWRRRFWTFLLKLAKNRPSWTLQAQPGPAVGPFHWQNRRLSVRELCRLQTFPDNITIVGGRTSAQRQLGNAVPSLLAEVLGRAIRKQLLRDPPSRSRPKLLPKIQRPIPPPEAPGPVPPEFLEMEGEHSPHPGTGGGYGALARQEARLG